MGLIGFAGNGNGNRDGRALLAGGGYAQGGLMDGGYVQGVRLALFLAALKEESSGVRQLLMGGSGWF